MGILSIYTKNNNDKNSICKFEETMCLLGFFDKKAKIVCSYDIEFDNPISEDIYIIFQGEVVEVHKKGEQADNLEPSIWTRRCTSETGCVRFTGAVGDYKKISFYIQVDVLINIEGPNARKIPWYCYNKRCLVKPPLEMNDNDCAIRNVIPINIKGYKSFLVIDCGYLLNSSDYNTQYIHDFEIDENLTRSGKRKKVNIAEFIIENHDLKEFQKNFSLSKENRCNKINVLRKRDRLLYTAFVLSIISVVLTIINFLV